MTLKKKNGLFNDIDQKGGWDLTKITISGVLEIVTCHWGRWVSEEDITVSKLALRVVLCTLKRLEGNVAQYCTR